MSSTIIITDKAQYESMKQGINEDPETGLTNKLLFLGELKDQYIGFLENEVERHKSESDTMLFSHTQAMDQLLKVQGLLHTAERERAEARLACQCMEELYKRALELHAEGEACPPDSFLAKRKCDHNCIACWEAHIKRGV